MIGIGTCTITLAQKMQNIRQNPSFNEWTDKLSGTQLLDLCQFLIQKSQEIGVQCQSFQLPFFDLSDDFENSVDKVAEFIYTILILEE